MLHKLAFLVNLIILVLAREQLFQSQKSYYVTPTTPLTCFTKPNYPLAVFQDNCMFVPCSEWNILVTLVFNNRNNFDPCQNVLQKTTSPCRDHSYLFMHSVKTNPNINPVHGSGNIENYLNGLSANVSRPSNGVSDLTNVLQAMLATANDKLITRGVNRAIIMTDFSCEILCKDSLFLETLYSTLSNLTVSGYLVDIHFLYGGNDNCTLFSEEFQKQNYTFSQECALPDASDAICNDRFANLTLPRYNVCDNFATMSPSVPTPEPPTFEIN